MITEGYLHTRNVRRYLLRLPVCAIFSEAPFDLMYSSSLFYPYHQNVIWTFLLSLLVIVLNEKCRARFKPVLAACMATGLVIMGFVAGFAVMADYYGGGGMDTALPEEVDDKMKALR